MTLTLGQLVYERTGKKRTRWARFFMNGKNRIPKISFITINVSKISRFKSLNLFFISRSLGKKSMFHIVIYFSQEDVNLADVAWGNEILYKKKLSR